MTEIQMLKTARSPELTSPAASRHVLAGLFGSLQNLNFEPCFGFRISDFGFENCFGFRASDFGFHLPLP
jgi:hypothetical protein